MCSEAGQSFWIMTSVALTTAIAVSPYFKFEFVGAAASNGTFDGVAPKQGQ
jgi:hypothetical protein